MRRRRKRRWKEAKEGEEVVVGMTIRERVEREKKNEEEEGVETSVTTPTIMHFIND